MEPIKDFIVHASVNNIQLPYMICQQTSQRINTGFPLFHQRVSGLYMVYSQLWVTLQSYGYLYKPTSNGRILEESCIEEIQREPVVCHLGICL
jgi:hypothetical protein